VRVAHTQIDYARLLGPGDPRSAELLDAAAETASSLELPLVARRVAASRERVG
jgi:hypothetical protein